MSKDKSNIQFLVSLGMRSEMQALAKELGYRSVPDMVYAMIVQALTQWRQTRKYGRDEIATALQVAGVPDEQAAQVWAGLES